MEHWALIKTHPNFEASNTGLIRNKNTGKILTAHANTPYAGMRVYLDGRKHYVHRLMADAFFDSDGSCSVRHIDGDPSNNHISNLELINPSKNYSITHFNTQVVPCKYCKHRDEYAFCYDRPDDFYCADGEF